MNNGHDSGLYNIQIMNTSSDNNDTFSPDLKRNETNGDEYLLSHALKISKYSGSSLNFPVYEETSEEDRKSIGDNLIEISPFRTRKKKGKKLKTRFNKSAFLTDKKVEGRYNSVEKYQTRESLIDAKHLEHLSMSFAVK
jgi:hypothetical protein